MAKSCSSLLSMLLWLGLSTTAAQAQVTPDSTLSTTVTSTDNLNFTIENGNTAGTNLFHSFDEFSVPTNGSAVFDNATTIENIFSRVTGTNRSNIDGLIQANGAANLFLLNPNGIVFGAGAELNIGGSFLATTADSLVFDNDVTFSATAAQDIPLLSINVPIGLQFGTSASSTANPPTIEVINTGHTVNDGFFRLLTGGGADVGLRAASQEAIALIGHNVVLSGGIISNTSGGQLHVGTPQSGTVGLSRSATVGWGFDYGAVASFGNVSLTDRASIDASGLDVGRISLNTQDLVVTDGALILAQNDGPQSAPDIQINATGDIHVIGLDSSASFASGIVSSAFANGRNSDINLSARNVIADSGGLILSVNAGSAVGGQVNIQVEDTLQNIGLAQNPVNFFSFIGSISWGTGDAGDLTATGRRLLITDGSQFVSGVSFNAPGNGGTIRVDFVDEVEVRGGNPVTLLESTISSSTTGPGDGGQVIINTEKVTLRSGGVIGSTAFADGDAGKVIVNATQEISISDFFAPEGERFAPEIRSVAGSANEVLQQTFGLPEVAIGNSGSVQITTPILSIASGGISISNLAIGQSGGTLQVNADQIYLDEQGQITAFTNTGNGGNIDLRANELLLMRDGSLINAESLSVGNGGNIAIDAPVIISLENSDVVANAVSGDGGNITINTQSIFGLEFRDQLTLESDITASSQFGVNGIIQINKLGIDPNSGLVELPEGLADSSNQIAKGCASNNGNTFISTGRGGMPMNPTELLMDGDRPWADNRDLSAFLGNRDSVDVPVHGAARSSDPVPVVASQAPALTEATTWHTHANGHLELVASHVAQPDIDVHATCAART